jgi:hypothetical protein
MIETHGKPMRKRLSRLGWSVSTATRLRDSGIRRCRRVAPCSGLAALGARFAVCDPELTAPRLIVERTRDHVLVGLHLATFEEPRELSRAVFRRYGGAMGLELRFAQTQADLDALVADMAAADLSDAWRMEDEGSPRVLHFRVGDKTLYGRFDPISESWLAPWIHEPQRFPIFQAGHAAAHD